MNAPAPKFVMFVRAVEGRAVHRWGSRNPDEMFGAVRRRLTADQKAAGESAIVWDTERVIPLDELYARRHRGELASALRHGDLQRVDEDAYKAWLAVAAKREEERVAALKQAEAKDSRGGKPSKRTDEEPKK